MWSRIPRITQGWWRRLGMAVVLGAATAAAFYWGRTAAPQVTAQAPPPKPLDPAVKAAANTPKTDYSSRIVAYIYGNVPITREDLGEYLIARFGAERVEFLVNRRIVEIEAEKRGIYVTDGEIKAAMEEDLKNMGILSEKDFANSILKRFNKTLYEWKEDVIRPKILLSKMARGMVTVEPQEIQKAFEATYGPKVQCRMIVLAKDNPQKFQIWERVNKGEEEFSREAKQQFIPSLAAQGGVVPAIHKHFPDATIEKEAFKLRPGEITALLGMEDGTNVILKCDKHIPADVTKRLSDEQEKLEKHLRDLKHAQKIPELFKQLQAQANPNILLTQKVQQEALERATLKEIGPTSNMPKLTAPLGN